MLTLLLFTAIVQKKEASDQGGGLIALGLSNRRSLVTGQEKEELSERSVANTLPKTC
jgi:hypothetical protein